MFLSELRIWNFRKFGLTHVEGQPDKPGLAVVFNSGLNLLIGENDSGKSAVIDAIRYIQLTQSREYIRLDYEDFHIPPGKNEEKDRATSLRIDSIFRGFRDEEAKNFLEWLGIENLSGNGPTYYLRLSLRARRQGKNIDYEVRAGVDDEGAELPSGARDLLRTTYLKPLRDAESELMPGRRSRLAQILVSHDAFNSDGSDHVLVKIFKGANESVRQYFQGIDENGSTESADSGGKEVLAEINDYLEEFFTDGEKKKAGFGISDPELKSILEKLELKLAETKVGLGSLNRLFMAAELLLLKRVAYTGLKLALIEEVEAHLHPQAQMRLIEYLQDEIAERSGVQLIVTSHSPNLASKVKLQNLIICKNDNAFPMGDSFTMLEKGDYGFLERFLDTTKANLFFAQGVIFVEGDAERLLIPTIAKLVGKDLSKHGTSIVSIGNTAFLRYSRIFKRRDGHEGLKIPVACITDNDIRPQKYRDEVDPSIKSSNDYTPEETVVHRNKKASSLDGQGVKTFISPNWTLEYDICLGNLSKLFYKAVLRAEKIQNSDKIGLTQEKINDVNKNVATDFKKWRQEGLDKPEIAFTIYYSTMIKKEISKAIVAQCFADLLMQFNGRPMMRKTILSDDKLKYIVDAINYATEPLNVSSASDH